MLGTEFDQLDKKLQKIGRSVEGIDFYGSFVVGRMKFKASCLLSLMKALANKNASLSLEHTGDGECLVIIMRTFGGGLTEEIMKTLISVKHLYKDNMIPRHGKHD